MAASMSTLGLRMNDDVVRVAVGLCLGVSLCQPHHQHQCGTEGKLPWTTMPQLQEEPGSTLTACSCQRINQYLHTWSPRV